MHLQIACHTPLGTRQAAILQPFGKKPRFTGLHEVSLRTKYR
jgi:hypothetical protein